MVKVNGGPIGPDGVGGSYHNTDSDDRAALWQSLGARQGLLSGGALTGVAGSLALSMAAFRASVAERDAAGNTLDRGYHAWSDDDVMVLFDPPAAQARNDAVVLAVADISAGSGAFGTGVSEAGPQVVAVPGVAGVTTPRSDADIQAWVGAGGWLRLADVPVNPGDTEIDTSTVSLADSSAARPHAKIHKTADQNIPNTTTTSLTYQALDEAVPATFADVANNQLVVPEDGFYLVTAQFRLDVPGSGGTMDATVRVNGNIVLEARASHDGGNASATCSGLLRLAEGDVLTAAIFQNTGSAGTSGTGGAGTNLAAARWD